MKSNMLNVIILLSSIQFYDITFKLMIAKQFCRIMQSQLNFDITFKVMIIKIIINIIYGNLCLITI